MFGLALFLAASCSEETDPSGQSSDGGRLESAAVEDQDIDGTDEAGQSATDAPDNELNDPQDPFNQLWVEYLSAHDVVMGGGEPPSGLDESMTANAITELINRGEANQRRLQDGAFDGVAGVVSSMNIETIATTDNPVLRDCTKQTIDSADGEPFQIWVDQRVGFVEGADGWRVDSVEVLQNGWNGDGGGPYGCIPLAYREVAEQTVLALRRGVEAFERDPEAGLSDEVRAVAYSGVESVLESGAASLREAGYYSDASSDVYLEVLGLSFSYYELNGPVIRVSTCVVYPDGKQFRSLDNDEVVREAYEPGHTQYFLSDVLITEGLVGEVVDMPLEPGSC